MEKVGMAKSLVQLIQERERMRKGGDALVQSSETHPSWATSCPLSEPYPPPPQQQQQHPTTSNNIQQHPTTSNNWPLFSFSPSLRRRSTSSVSSSISFLRSFFFFEFCRFFWSQSGWFFVFTHFSKRSPIVVFFSVQTLSTRGRSIRRRRRRRRWPMATATTGRRRNRRAKQQTNKHKQNPIFFLLSFCIRSPTTETLQQTTTRKKGTRETKQWRRRKQRTSERPAIIRSDADANIIKQRRRLRRAQHSTTIIPKYFFFLSLSLSLYIYIYICMCLYFY